MNKVGFVSLGCPKALVDSERIITQLKAEGYGIAPDYGSADLVIVNTCGFINPAVEESLDAIAEALRENGKVIITGCLGEKPEVITEKYPEVLAITGSQKYEEVMEAVHKVLPKPAHNPHLDLIPESGFKLTPRHYAYLKIAEGCDHKCSFCIIPQLRGKLQSQNIGEVLREANGLVKAGVKELLIIAQDSAAFGADKNFATELWRGRELKNDLLTLIEELSQLGIWLRLHYLYPYPVIDDLVALMAEGKLLPYLDMPMQHSNPRLLKLMRRPANLDKTLERIKKWRKICPDLAIRSNFIVGFPSETEEEFKELLDFMEEAKINRAAVFAYSDVEGATANNLQGQISEEVKAERIKKFEEKQRKISADLLSQKIGEVLPVLIDEVNLETQTAIARTAYDAPEIDGLVYLSQLEGVKAGEIIHAEIEDSDENDLFAKAY